MKTHEQNRNNKRTEIERFDWFVERIQTLVAFGWLSECSGGKNFIPENFPEINRYFALTSYLNTIGQSNSAVSTCMRENKESMFFDKTNNEHLPKPSKENLSIDLKLVIKLCIELLFSTGFFMQQKSN